MFVLVVIGAGRRRAASLNNWVTWSQRGGNKALVAPLVNGLVLQVFSAGRVGCRRWLPIGFLVTNSTLVTNHSFRNSLAVFVSMIALILQFIFEYP